ncbi:hypothetical protein M409DRAFT_55352 [Zasmidium cellare ATCC 36951]|uniref:Vacuolar membrane-associated protein IML1 n=1 Tax=Zasmidium cellare ATCC 36951 TaxID=1080233 RepID=A0A6A6CIH6_ZASCE|nr:uncharacterized protein M409DRAFT_55352 [Zasmidium cellare ATCC 36951]KAF2166000.1 hypothetical protein M409DRAFT_55352 [Zasmidium cellare ATCC 36951]
MAIEMEEKLCTIVLHDDRVTKKDVLASNRAMHVGEFAYLNAPGARTLCIAPAGLASNSTEISIHVTLAQKFGFENRTQGRIQIIEDPDPATATHVEMFFRDQFLSRADMWQLMGRLQDTVLYHGQTINYLGSETAEVKQIYIAGQEVESAISSHPHTKPIFRSGSARYTILIEVSREMLENWSNGDLMYERMIDGFLPALFRRWESLKVKHQISIVLFGRIVNVHASGNNGHADKVLDNEDFFHVLVSEVASASWRQIMRRLKRAFNDHRLPHSVSLAADTNMLEAIHLTAMDFADDQNDAHLMSTGTSMIAITAGSGLFEADHTLLKQTTDLLVGNSIGVDIVALSPKPLHPVPLFRYDHNGTVEFALPHWVDISFWRDPHDEARSTWTLTNIEEPVEDIALPLLRESGWSEVDTSTMDYHDNQVFQDRGPSSQSILDSSPAITTVDPIGSVETMKGVPIPGSSPKKNNPTAPVPVDESPRSGNSDASNKEPLSRAKRPRLPPHPLMQSGRKISVGPKGLAPSRGVASTTLSTAHAQHEREMGLGISATPSDSSNGLAKAIRRSLARQPSQQSLVSHRTSGSDQYQTSRPIDIASVPESSEDEESSDPAGDLKQGIADTMVGTALEHETSLSATPKAKNMFPRKGSMNDSLDMLSPWVMLLNPCNPRRDNMRVASQYRKWQHVFPRAVSSGAFKWSSMCSPAALPLTAEYKPSASELETHYRKKVRRHVISNSSGLKNETARVLVERLIDVRLIRGFQIVAIRNTGSDHTFQSKDKPVLLSLGRRYHELQRFSDFEIQVVQYDPKTGIGSEDNGTQHYLTSYEPKMRIMTGMTVKPEVTYHSESPIADWSSLDEYILGLLPAPEVNASFKVRLILVPVEMTKSDRNAQTRLGGLSDEERRIEGIQRLTQTWQRQRHFSVEDQQRHVSITKSKPTSSAPERDQNPLAIDYQTKDTSIIVNAQGHTLPSQLEGGELSTPLFKDSEKHHSSNFDLEKLVKQMQELPPFGVEMRDRRWLTLTHLKCFRGDEMTSWLQGAFKDLELREDAVALGNELMNRGIFSHVRQKHKFRDGNYFYQIASAHRTTEYPDTQGLFSKAPWRSIPATPIAESVKSPIIRPLTNDSSSSSGRPTPVLGPIDHKAKEVLLSQMMRYNVDPQKKSDHLQVIDLHYDRIHNPENCYHIQLEWLGASTKLVREAISRWSSTIDGYGLKLIQVPLQEASKFREHHPFDQPQPIRLAVRPPDKILATPIIQPHSVSPRPVEDHFAYHKAILRQHDFALDYEAASEFNTDLQVTYSWGPPTYSHTQFVHKSGLVLAQILSNEVGDFILLPNRLASSRTSSASTSSSSSTATKLTDVETIESITRSFKDFCRNEEMLKQFFSQADRPKGFAPSPFAGATLAADFDVPPMQLPPHLSHRAQGHRHLLGMIE